MTEWHMIIDPVLCENCNNCVLAVKDEYVGNDFPGYTAPHPDQGQGVIRIGRVVRGSGSQIDTAYLPQLCNHCADAPCQRYAPDVVRRREDGIVIIDPERARGRRDLVDSCPYGAIVWNEAEQLPQQWIFDAHLLDQGWKEPRIQTVCPTEAITCVRTTPAAMAARVQAEGLEVLKPELQTKPRVYYRNLYRVRDCFVAGSVAVVIGTGTECCAGATVTLEGGATVQSVTTDHFGDFKFDGLPTRSGPYRLTVIHPDFGTVESDVGRLESSLSLGEILLQNT